MLFKAMLEYLATQLEKCIRKTAEEEPGRAADLLLKLAEFHIPKLQHLAIDLTKIPIEDIFAGLTRREAVPAHDEKGGANWQPRTGAVSQVLPAARARAHR